MKNLKSFTMGYVLTGLVLTACENGGEEFYGSPKNIQAVKEYSNQNAELFRFTVKARDWKIESSVDRFVKIPLPYVTDSVMKEGLVIVYLQEAGKTVSLPFTYYQMRRAMSFQPSYEPGFIYINILGNFILNTQVTYTFKVLILDAGIIKKFKRINWNNYDQAMQAIRIKPGSY